MTLHFIEMAIKMRTSATLIAVLVALLGVAQAEHRFKTGDDIMLLANKVGPFNNPR